MRVSHHHPPDLTQDLRETTLTALYRTALNALRDQENGARYWRVDPPVTSARPGR